MPALYASRFSPPPIVLHMFLPTAGRGIYDLLAQESWTLTRAECAAPAAGLYTHVGPDESEIEYTREILEDYLDRSEMGILIAAMFGDNAARELGYEQLGLSDWAGLWSTLWRPGQITTSIDGSQRRENSARTSTS
jgi:hypothetical protein